MHISLSTSIQSQITAAANDQQDSYKCIHVHYILRFIALKLTGTCSNLHVLHLMKLIMAIISKYIYIC